jgi:hypothetical protein
MADGFKIADAFVEITVRDNTRGEERRIEDRLNRIKATAKVGVDIDDTGVTRASGRIKAMARGIENDLNGAKLRGGAALTILSASTLKTTAIAAGVTSAVGLAAAAVGGIPVLAAAAGAVGGVAVGAFNGIGDAMKAAGKDAAAYDAAMKKLTPSGRALVEQLQRMKPLLQGLRDEAQTAFLPGVTAMLRDSEGLFPIFRENIRKTGEIMGDSARKMGELFKSDAFKANLKGLLDASAPIVRAIGDGLVGLTGSLVKFGAKMAPVALGVADFINGVVAGFKGLLDRLAPHAESFKRIFSALGKVFEVLLPAIGDVAGQIADWLAPAIEKLARWMSEHQDQLGGWIKALGIFFLTLKGLKIVGEVTTWTKSVVGLLDTVGKSAFINEGKVGKLAKSLGGVARFLGGAALVGGLALGGDALIPEKVGEKGSSGQHFRDELHGLAEAIRDPQGALNDMKRQFAAFPADFRASPFMHFFRDTLPEFWRGLWGRDGTIAHPIFEFRDSAIARVSETYNGIRGWFQRIPADVTGWFRDARNGAVDWVSNLARSIGDGARNGWRGISDAFARLPRDVAGWFTDARNTAVDRVTGMARGLLDGARNGWRGISDWFSRLPADVSGWFQRTRDSAVTWLGNLARGAAEAAASAWRGLSDWFSRLPRDVSDWFSRSRDAVVERMSNLARSATDFARDGWRGLSDWFARLPGDVSGWFQRTRDSAVNWMGNLARGALDQASAAWRSISDWFSRLPGDVGRWFTDTRNAAADLMARIARAVTDSAAAAWRGLSDWFSRMPRDTGDWLRGTWNSVTDWLGRIADSFRSTVDWVRTKWAEIKAAANDPVRWVIDWVYDRGIKPVWNNIADVFGMHRLARGGTVPGADLGYDYVPALLRGGEGVLVPEAVAALGGESGIHALNRAAERQRFADGGVAGFHGSGGATATVNRASGSVTASTGISAFLSDLFGDPVAAVRHLFGDVMAKARQIPGAGMLHDAVAKIPHIVLDAIIGKAKSYATSFVGGGGGAAAPSGQISGWIAQALSIMRLPMSYAAGLYQQIMTESGGNPGVTQHGYTDINTVTGNLAQGIMQVIPPTFRAHALPGHGNPFNPVDNIIAGARYALGRYGAGWFAPGPRHSHGYDSGGLATSAGLLPKYTQQPERVLSPRQTEAFERALDGGFGGGGSTWNVTVTIDAQSVAEMKSVTEFFDKVQQTARRGPTSMAGVRR